MHSVKLDIGLVHEAMYLLRGLVSDACVMFDMIHHLKLDQLISFSLPNILEPGFRDR